MSNKGKWYIVCYDCGKVTRRNILKDQVYCDYCHSYCDYYSWEATRSKKICKAIIKELKEDRP